MYGYIYKTTCLLDGRVYIGQRRGRFTLKYKGSGNHLRLALKKYGDVSFSVDLIKTASSQFELDFFERFYIGQFRRMLTPEMVFNIADGGLNGISMSGKNNPMFGSKRTGQENPNWKGGVCQIKTICCDCKKEVSRGSSRCKSCAGKRLDRSKFISMAKKRGPSWNKGLTKETSPIVAKMALSKVKG